MFLFSLCSVIRFYFLPVLSFFISCLFLCPVRFFLAFITPLLFNLFRSHSLFYFLSFHLSPFCHFLLLSVLYFSLISFIAVLSLLCHLFLPFFVPFFLFVHLCPPHFLSRSTKASHEAPSVCCLQPLNCTEVRPCHDKCIVCPIFTQSPGPIVRCSDNKCQT